MHPIDGTLHADSHAAHAAVQDAHLQVNIGIAALGAHSLGRSTSSLLVATNHINSCATPC